MTTTTKGVPIGYHTATPYLLVRDADQAIAFYEKAFGAIVLKKHADPQGVVRNVQIRIGDSPLMLGIRPNADEMSQESIGDLPLSSIYLFVENADETFAKAIAHGAKGLYPPEDMEYGYREGGIVDPFRITWWIATPIHEV